MNVNLNLNEINNYLQPFFANREDNFQEAWAEILESAPRTLKEIDPIINKVRTRAIKQYMNKKYKEVSLYTPIIKNGDDKFTLESILGNPESEPSEDRDNRDNGLYKKIVDFLIVEYIKQKNENIELRRRDIEIKAERLRLRRDLLNFKRHRFESWKRLMEEKGRQRENRFTVKIQLRREILEFRKERFYLKEKKRKQKAGEYE